MGTEGYRTPAAFGEAELTEKRSRFISRVWPVETEAEALEHLRAMREKHWDATHNVYAYILRQEGVMRYSDDGEPQGSSGLPVLNVFRGRELTNLCCVVTRYFGGILLGTGGLARTYSRCARLALEAAGISQVGLWERLLLACPYPLYERIRRELETAGAILEQTDFGADVSMELLLPAGGAEGLNRRLGELSGGSVEALVLGEEFRGVPIASKTEEE